ncbi:N-acetyltransferase [Synechococcus sp. CS-1332]|uniref:GNAT family N-acetyltransferase n=1 Tax=Synechococcus sp. CS-1332 TaxID=2847972 RepID=UPI00223B28A8|nr:GNAT family N-acetyltransferase [Synechococcus sp. CS-1332]MCT0207577.1 GNAT family N-acetyltransferase [Synechococcus sp. CS-1332]
MIIGPIQEHEREVLLGLAVSTGLFTAEDAEGLLGGVLDSLAAGELPEGHTVVACRESRDGPAIGWSYYAPDPYAETVWNVWWIGVSPSYHGDGVGQAILSNIERDAAALGARVIVIETSDQAPLARARNFYLKRGYEERGRIPDFYAEGDSKVIFSRSLAGAA